MTIKSILTLAAATTLMMASAQTTIAQENDRSYMLQITEVEAKIGHRSQFREGMEAYMACYEQNGGDRSWSTWNNVDGKGDTYHLVSRMDSWAELDTPDEASRACWSTIEESVAPHVSSVSSSFARHLPDWSGETENYNVVRLHKFRVGNAREFRENVGAITEILKDNDYDHLGVWYGVIGSDSSEPNYFVVESFDNFAAIDEREGPYQALVNAVGEERADGLWNAFGDSLRDDGEYASDLLVRVPELSRNAAE